MPEPMKRLRVVRKTIYISDQAHAGLLRWIENDVENFSELVIGLLYAAKNLPALCNTDFTPNRSTETGQNEVLPIEPSQSSDPIASIASFLDGVV